MKTPLHSATRWLPAIALVLATCWAPSQAERGPQRGASAGAGPVSARVIVKFRSDASADLRRQIQSASRGEAGAQAAVAQSLQARADALGGRRGLALRTGRGIDARTQVVMADGVDGPTLAARLSADSDVEYAVVDYKRRAFRVPNDVLYTPTVPQLYTPTAGQWYLKAPAADKISTGSEIVSAANVEGAWDYTLGSSSIVVADLDTGVRFDHPDLAGKLLAGYDMVADATVANDGNGRDADASDPGDWVTDAEVNDANSPFYHCTTPDSTGKYFGEPSSWHGTQTAGIIGAATNNGIGMAGVGWNVKVLPVRVLGRCFGYDSDIIAGMRWAAGLTGSQGVPDVPVNPTPARVLNMSLGSDGSCTSAYASAVSDIVAAGAVIVAAAGNDAGHPAGVPANCSGVVGVSALRHIGTKVGFSNIGTSVTIAAPGGNCLNLDITPSTPCVYPILTTANIGTTTPVPDSSGGSIYTDGINYSVGTSFATPIVAGTVGLMLSAEPALTAPQVRSILQQTARVFPFRGAPDDTTVTPAKPVAQCTAPSSSVDQNECYCTTSTCGAGMLDAAMAVYAAQNGSPVGVISPSSTAPAATVMLTLASNLSTAATGRSIVSSDWSIIDGGGIVASFSGGGTTASGSSVSVTPSAAGQFSVRLKLTDSAGVVGYREQTFVVGSAPVTPPPSTDSGGGGGAMSALWLAGLALAVWALAAARRRA